MYIAIMLKWPSFCNLALFNKFYYATFLFFLDAFQIKRCRVRQSVQTVAQACQKQEKHWDTTYQQFGWD